MLFNTARYGTLLGISLVLLEVVRRAHITQKLPFDLYAGIIALVFLILGGLVVLIWRGAFAQKIVRPRLARIAHNGEFSARELDVLVFLVHGYTNKEIAQNLKITPNTVKSHLKNIYGKLEVSNRTQAAAEAKLLGVFI